MITNSKELIKWIIPDKVLHEYRMIINHEYKKNFFKSAEIERIKKLPRFTEGSTNLINKELFFVDSASFLFIYEEVFNKGIYAFTCSKPNPYIIDCGANIGLSVIYFKMLFPDSEILAFEPDPKVFELLKKNTAFYKNVNVIEKALWHEETTLEFFSEGADGGSINNVLNSQGLIKIKTQRLRNYLNKPVDFLKIDIEGAELMVIKDCEDKLLYVQNIFIEYHSFVNKDQELSSLVAILERNNFRYHITSPGLASSQPFIKLNTYNNMDMQLNIYAYKK